MSRRVLVAVVFAASAIVALGAEAQVIERVDVCSDGGEPALGATVSQPDRSVDASGRFVVFASDSADLVPDDSNGVTDVFLRDRALDTTVRISLAADGGNASGASDNPAISDNGRFIAFASVAEDLVEGDSNGVNDIYLWDRLAHTMTRISVAYDGSEPDGDSDHPVLSADGRHLAFRSNATNLVPEGANSNGDIYVYDRALDELTKVTVRYDGTLTELNSWLPAISADGRHVAFVSGDGGLVPEDLISPQDVFVYDLDTATMERVSIATDGTEGTDRNGPPSLSADGSVVAWWSRATELVPDDSNGLDDIFVRDRSTGTTTRVSVSSAGEQAEGGGSWHASISDDGRWVAFCSDAKNLVSDDTGIAGGVFSHDRLTGITRRHSETLLGGEASGYSRRPTITPDGAYVVFESGAPDLIEGDGNASQDVFVAWGPDMLNHTRTRRFGGRLVGE